MNLVKWNPWNEMMSFRNRFDRLFNEGLFPSMGDPDAMELAGWNPAVDIFDKDDRIVLKAELPGVDRDHLSLDVNGRLLTLKGERSDETEVKEDRFYRRERVYGRFERSFNLPHEVDADAIKAEFKDGILTVEIPKPEDRKPKQISVH